MLSHLPTKLRLELLKEMFDIIDARRRNSQDPTIGSDIENYLLEQELENLKEVTESSRNG